MSYTGKNTINSTSIFEIIEKLISKHFENNFFLSSDTKRLDDYILHENYIKVFNDESRFIINYSIHSLFTLYKLLDKFQDYNIREIFDNDKNLNFRNEDSSIGNQIINNIFAGKKEDIIIAFVNNHINIVIEDINNSTVINIEAEQKLCYSLFVIRKIIKDFPFYFNSKDFENIFNKLKHLKQ